MNDAFAGKKVLITGGAGFLGSNLAIRLADRGADVTAMDIMLPEYGGNLFNLEPVRERVRVNFADIRDGNAMNYLVRGMDFVFHLAGQVSHIKSFTDPFQDIDINIKGSAMLMEACRKHNPGVKVVYTGTRGQYGKKTTLPVREDAELDPRGIYELSNLAAEKLIKIYHDVHQVRSVLLRLTNIYGPRAQMKTPHYGVANWFIRLALENETLRVFGDGSMLRDFLYVDDTVDAMLRCAAEERAEGGIFNVGRDTPVTILDFVKKVVEIAGSGRWEYAPFTAERAAQEPGSYYSDITRIRDTVGWEPRTDIEEGIGRTVAYYREHRGRYW